MKDIKDNSYAAEFIFEPSLAADLTVQSIKAARSDPDQLTTGIPQLDDHFVMMRPRRVIGVLADTSNGKTSVMNIIARSFMSQVKDNEIVIYATWEDSIEDMTLNHMANVSKIPLPALWSGKLDEAQWDKMIRASVTRATMPLWLIGHSEQREATRPRLTMSDISAALGYLRGRQIKVRAIFLDYLQRINRDDQKGQIREQYMRIMDSVKDLALQYNTTCVIGTQVSRDVAERKNRMPQIHDAQETSNFEHTCDGMIGLWIPAKSPEYMNEEIIPGDPATNQPRVVVTRNLMLIQTIKQKRGEAPVLRPVDFIPAESAIRTYTPPVTVRL